MLVNPTWTRVDGGACLVREGGNARRLADRVAFIEKTPRIRIRAYRNETDDYLNWAQRPFKGDGPDDEASRKWCEDALVLFGHELRAAA